MQKLTLAAFALTVASTGAFASSHGNALVMSGPLNGEVFIMAQNHFTLYTYAKDTKGVSNCYGKCAKNWPPALLDASQAKNMPESYSLIQRSDGTLQIAFKGQPLYLYRKDKSIGEMNGVGINPDWKLARP